ncbi:MAG: SMP-30/gluconolactonase/LRE family protein [Cyclobacteriaceae bacterium]
MRLLCAFFLLSLFACGSDDSEEPQSQNNFTVTTLAGPFNGSGGATVDKAGNIYVADFGNNLNRADGTTVTKVTPSGEVSTFADGLNGASGNAFDSQGNLFQANIAGNTLSKIAPDGTVSTFATSNLRSPVGVAIDPEDNIYVCNCGGASIARFSPNGNGGTFISNAELSCPNGIAIDDSGNLYPVNFNNGKVFKITPNGVLSEFAVVPGTGNAHITFVNGKLYVVSRGAAMIYELTLDGTLTHIAGTGEVGNEDGPALEATFFIPNGITHSPDGSKLYVISRVLNQGSPLNPVLVRVINLTP